MRLDRKSPQRGDAMTFPAKAVANFFLEKGFKEEIPISPMKVQKLVYFGHGWSLGLTGDPFIEEVIEAWPYGPVIKSLYHEFKGYGNGPITVLATEAVWPTGTKFEEMDVVAPRITDGDPSNAKRVIPLLNRV